jgi:small-conductance mechanosensitive channel
VPPAVLVVARAAQPAQPDGGASPGEQARSLVDAVAKANWAEMAAHAAVIVLIVVLAAVAARFARREVRRYVSRATARGLAKFQDPAKQTRVKLRSETLGGVMGDVARGVIWVLALFAVLGEIGVELGPLVAGAGIAGVALGFGAQSLVKDFFSGFFILLEDQFGVGDVITVTSEVAGVVEDISLRVTRLRSLDGTVWFVPNGEIHYLGNKSKEWARALVDFEVAYGEDVREVTEVIREVSHALRKDQEVGPKILEDAEILGVEVLGESGVTIRTFLKTLPLEQWAVARRFRQEVKSEFDARGIEIPFPHRKLIVEDGRPREVAPPPGGSTAADETGT